MFKNDDESHKHSLTVLNGLYEYDDFMMSINRVIDLGCGSGKDMLWWVTRTTRDEPPLPLDIKCHGIDLFDILPAAKHSLSITYEKLDFENTATLNGKFDILWSHDAFQYAIDPITTLTNWRKIAAPGAMLVLTVPQTVNLHHKEVDISQQDGCYHHYTIVSLLHMLALTGWDCRSGFFKKVPNEPWIYAVVYNSEQPARDAKTTRWYDLAESNLLPESAVKSINATGYLHQKDLVLPWLDKSLGLFNI